MSIWIVPSSKFTNSKISYENVLGCDAEFVTEAEEDDSFVEEPDSMYFGMKEYCDSIKWTHQFPLIRQDDAFERMALRTSRYDHMELGWN